MGHCSHARQPLAPTQQPPPFQYQKISSQPVFALSGATLVSIQRPTAPFLSPSYQAPNFISVGYCSRARGFATAFVTKAGCKYTAQNEKRDVLFCCCCCLASGVLLVLPLWEYNICNEPLIIHVTAFQTICIRTNGLHEVGKKQLFNCAAHLAWQTALIFICRTNDFINISNVLTCTHVSGDYLRGQQLENPVLGTRKG